ncbi:MAG: hypothetical protein DMF56_20855 [Acidobacteria bacterium]|nr:MAG: hypothetical protein DMF56_20855 [Acidobacteriota bacterium]
MTRLIDHFLPHCDFVERHSIVVRASPERIYEVIRRGELTQHPIVRALLKLRGLGRPPKKFNLDAFLGAGFGLLAEDPPNEIVLGIQGPFWKPTCKLHVVDAEAFRTNVPEGVARAAWNFAIDSHGRVTTETRILCADDARMKFRLYWTTIRPFSGLIRRMMLRAIRKEAERFE